MAMLGLVANACAAVGLFYFGSKTEDKFGRSVIFVVAALNLVVLLLNLLA
jgi:hypothetical protein